MFWSVITTHRAHELLACEHIIRLGYLAYCPQLAVRYRSQLALRPLFAGYAFVGLENEQPWTPVRYAPGVRSLLADDRGKPHHVDAAIVEQLQASEETRHVPAPLDALHRPGAAVALSGGPFAGHCGVVLAIKRATAVIALIVFGAPQKVSVPLSYLAEC